MKRSRGRLSDYKIWASFTDHDSAPVSGDNR